MSTFDFDLHKSAAKELRGYLKNDDLPLEWAVGFASAEAWGAVQRAAVKMKDATYRQHVEAAALELESRPAEVKPCRFR